MLERIERILIAVLSIALLAGIGFSVYRQSRPADIRIQKFNPADLQASAPAAARAAGGEDQAQGRININLADADEIASLKGVGKALAGRIVAYRSESGLFISPEDIKKVKGIGDALFEKIKDRISTE